jgi:hypothetical protein
MKALVTGFYRREALQRRRIAATAPFKHNSTSGNLTFLQCCDRRSAEGFECPVTWRAMIAESRLLVKPLMLDRRKVGGQKTGPCLPGWELNARQIISPRI